MSTHGERMPRPPRPLHLRPTAILVVFAGGAVGTLSRYLVGIALPPLGPLPSVTLLIGGIPIATLLVNVVGAFLLGLLLGGIALGSWLVRPRSSDPTGGATR